MTHDAAEWAVGDLPYDAREGSAALAAAVEEAEAEALDGMGLAIHLSWMDRRRLAFIALRLAGQ